MDGTEYCELNDTFVPINQKQTLAAMIETASGLTSFERVSDIMNRHYHYVLRKCLLPGNTRMTRKLGATMENTDKNAIEYS